MGIKFAGMVFNEAHEFIKISVERHEVEMFMVK